VIGPRVTEGSLVRFPCAREVIPSTGFAHSTQNVEFAYGHNWNSWIVS